MREIADRVLEVQTLRAGNGARFRDCIAGANLDAETFVSSVREMCETFAIEQAALDRPTKERILRERVRTMIQEWMREVDSVADRSI